MEGWVGLSTMSINNLLKVITRHWSWWDLNPWDLWVNSQRPYHYATKPPKKKVHLCADVCMFPVLWQLQAQTHHTTDNHQSRPLQQPVQQSKPVWQDHPINKLQNAINASFWTMPFCNLYTGWHLNIISQTHQLVDMLISTGCWRSYRIPAESHYITHSQP